MKTNLLLPSYFKYIGWLLAVPGLVLGYLFEFEHFKFGFLQYGNNWMALGSDNFTDEYIITFLVLGFVFIGFSKQKNETGNTSFLRFKALFGSILITAILILSCIGTGLISSYLSKRYGLQESKIFSYIFFPFSYSFACQLSLFNILFYYDLLFSKKHNSVITPPLKHKFFHITGITIFSFCVLSSMICFFRNSFDSNYSDWIGYITVFGLLILTASKEKTESILISDLRKKSLQISLFITTSIFLISTWLVYGANYLYFLYSYPLYLLMLYNIVFQYNIHRSRMSQQVILA